MDLRGHDDDSDGDDFLPHHHRRLGLGRLYQEGELGGMPPSSSSAVALPPSPSSLNYNHSGILASGSAFRRPTLFPSPLSSSTLPPSPTPLSSHRQQQHAHQQQHGGGRSGIGGLAAEVGENSHKPPPVQLPSSLDPNLSLVGDRPQQQQQQQQQQQGEAPKEQPDAPAAAAAATAAAAPRAFPTTASAPPSQGGGASSSTPRAETGVAATTRTRPPSPAAASSTGPSVRYRECLKNHAARVGGHVLDGCGEFMPGGEDGTPEALRCAACTCHRSFHRKEVEGREEAEGLFLPVSSASPPRGALQHGNSHRYYFPGGAGNGAYPGGAARGGGMGSSGARSLHNPSPLSLQTPATRGRHQQHQLTGLLTPSSGGVFAPSGVVAFGGGNVDDEDNTNYSGGTTTTESSSEEMQAQMLAVAAPTSFHHAAPQTTLPPGAGASQQQQQQYPVQLGASSTGSTRKRFRTKFTQAQKEMMAGFAERVGWRMQKQDDAAVEEFCREAGVSRQVFKVWMHNNKHTLFKSKQQQQQQQQQPQQQQKQPPNGDQQQQSSSSS